MKKFENPKEHVVHTILYIEDNDENLELVKQMLHYRDRVRFISAMDGVSGLQIAQDRLPDLILLDINLPGLDGLTVLKELKACKETANIPVIAVSADALKSQIEDAMKQGFTDYVTKPVNIQKFLEKIDEILEKGDE